VIASSAKGRAEKIELPKKSRQRRQTGQRQQKDRDRASEEWRPGRQSGEIFQIVAATFAANNADDCERADQSDTVDAGIKQRGRKPVAAASDETEQSVATMRDGRVSEQPTHIRLRECHKIAEQDRQGGQRGEDG